MEHFKRWVNNPQVRDWICQDWASPEERERRLREIFGRAPKASDEAATDGPESNPVKPDQTESNQLNQKLAARPFLDSCQFDQSRLNRASKRVVILTCSLALEEGAKGMSSQNQESTRLCKELMQIVIAFNLAGM